MYLGDTARVPYGTKSAPTVTQYSRESTHFLQRHDAKAVVVACNTASAFAVPTLKNEWDLPLLGVLEPGAAKAVALTRRGRIGVIGTAGTIGSGAYEEALLRLNPDLTVVSQACPLFVPLVEEGWLDRPETFSVAREYLAPLLAAEVDTLILGCTHYPMLKATLQEVAGPDVKLIDSAEVVAEALEENLRNQSLLRTESGRGAHQFWVTDSIERFKRVGETFLGTPLHDVQKVDSHEWEEIMRESL